MSRRSLSRSLLTAATTMRRPGLCTGVAFMTMTPMSTMRSLMILQGVVGYRRYPGQLVPGFIEKHFKWESRLNTRQACQQGAAKNCRRRTVPSFSRKPEILSLQHWMPHVVHLAAGKAADDAAVVSI